uniref:Uncharacterized protein n=1 Tax=Ditylenchus dipsaci TaxID=166011 RepID=A0A915CVR0_9BILA
MAVNTLIWVYSHIKWLLSKHERHLQKEKSEVLLTPIVKEDFLQFVKLMDVHPQNLINRSGILQKLIQFSKLRVIVTTTAIAEITPEFDSHFAKLGCPITLLHSPDLQSTVLGETIVNKGQQQLAVDLTKLLVLNGLGKDVPVCVKLIQSSSVIVCGMGELPAKRSPVVVYVTSRTTATDVPVNCSILREQIVQLIMCCAMQLMGFL